MAARRLAIAALTAALMGGGPEPASAQDLPLPPALVGGAAGFAAGTYTTFGIVIARARLNEEYVESTSELIGPLATPIILWTATGVAVGIASEERLYQAIIGGIGGTALGAAAGLVWGASRWDGAEGKWGGAVIGGAIGMAGGVAAGLLWPTRSRPDGGLELPLVIRLPVRLP